MGWGGKQGGRQRSGSDSRLPYCRSLFGSRRFSSPGSIPGSIASRSAHHLGMLAMMSAVLVRRLLRITHADDEEDRKDGDRDDEDLFPPQRRHKLPLSRCRIPQRGALVRVLLVSLL